MKTTILAVIPSFTPTPILAQATMDGFKNFLGSLVGIIMAVAFVIAIVIAMVGILQREDNPANAKKAFVTAALLASVVTIVTILFVAAGMGGATVGAKF